MITQERIAEIGALLPFGTGHLVAQRAGVSDAMVSMLFNGKLKNLDTDVVAKIITESIGVIKERSESRRSLIGKLEDILSDIKTNEEV